MSDLAKTTLTDLNQSVQLSHLDAAILLHRVALRLRPSPHPKRLKSLGALAAALYAQFRCTDEMLNLDEAISMLREAVEACLEVGMYRTELLGNLCAVLITKFDKTSDLQDLHEAMTRCCDVLQPIGTTGTNNSEEGSQLLGFAADLAQQFQQSGQIADLETAISLARESRALLPIHDPKWLLASNNLAILLHIRFDQLGQHEDLDEAISFHRETLELPTCTPSSSIQLTQQPRQCAEHTI